MDASRIAELLEPFLIPLPVGSISGAEAAEPSPLSSEQLDRILIYIDLLLRWNARINLTAVRSPEEIVTRHFGESLWAARHLLPCSADTPVREAAPVPSVGAPPERRPYRIVDLGSGAGFPGIPLKIWCLDAPVTLIESNQKKVAFLREVIRTLTLTDIDVFPGRAEDYPQASAFLVTLRAVEHFEGALPVATRLLAPEGRLALLIGQSQVALARQLAQSPAWSQPVLIPNSQSRVLLVGRIT